MSKKLNRIKRSAKFLLKNKDVKYILETYGHEEYKKYLVNSIGSSSVAWNADSFTWGAAMTISTYFDKKKK